jgi:hypothetical protein
MWNLLLIELIRDNVDTSALVKFGQIRQVVIELSRTQSRSVRRQISSLICAEFVDE